MSDIKVSIITPAFNSEKTISRTIESVLNQDYPYVEYIIVDGGSEDKTVEIAENYKTSFEKKNYKYIILSEADKGMYDALNKGIRLATGFLIGNINADDKYYPDTISKMVSLYNNNKGYDVAWADIKILRNGKPIIKKAAVKKIFTTSHFCHPTMFAKKKVLLKYPYALRGMDDDFDFILRVHKAGLKILTYNGKPLADYSLGGMSTKKSIKLCISRIKMKYGTYRRNGYCPLYFFYCILIEAVKYILGG